MNPVDVIIPIHDAREFTIRCIESVLAHTPPGVRVVLADDASRDPELVRFLDETAAREPHVELRRSERNLGFVRTCNAAMAAADGRDILLLNSDTVVPTGYLERLQRTASAYDATGIVCPLSNNATILSVPRFCEDNPIPPGHTTESFAALVARVSPRLAPEIVTGVGFCMYVKAEVLARIGSFDQQNFGRGYGEENDFCERALAAGYRIRLADDAFVFHQGGASFGAETDERKRIGTEAMARLHPEYFIRVAHFIDANPLRPIHDAIDLGLARRHTEAPALLVLVHASLDRPAGGSEHHVRELLETLRLPRVLVAVPDASGISLSEIFDGDFAGAIAYRFSLGEPLARFTQTSPEIHDALLRICRAFAVGAAHIHHLLYWPLDVWRSFEELGIPYTLTTHDFYTLCPSHNLVNSTTGKPCCLSGSPSDEERRACIEELFHNLALPLREPALSFRDSHCRAARPLIDRAHSLVFPSAAAEAIFRAQAGAVPAASRVIPHGYDAVPLGPRPDREDARLQIAFLGEIAYKTKGADDILALLRKCRTLGAVWHVFGNVGTFGYRTELERVGLGSGLILHGPYARDTIGALLRRNEIDVAVFLPAAPETFSFTLSEALTAGVPVIVNRSGALPERVESSGAGLVVNGVEEAAAALSRLVYHRLELRPLREAAARFRHRTLEEMAADYRRLYDELLPTTAARVASPDTTDDARLLVELRRAGLATGPAIRDRRIPRARWLSHPVVRRIAKGAVPERLRRALRPATAPLTVATQPPQSLVQSLRLEDARARSDLRPLRRLAGSVRYEAAGNDPTILLPIAGAPFDITPVRTIEFDLLCKAPGAREAQLFWTHVEGENFSEEKSIRVPLTGDGVWRTYSVDIARSDKREAWSAGTHVWALRFDPMDGPGVVAVGGLRFLR